MERGQWKRLLMYCEEKSARYTMGLLMKNVSRSKSRGSELKMEIDSLKSEAARWSLAFMRDMDDPECLVGEEAVCLGGFEMSDPRSRMCSVSGMKRMTTAPRQMQVTPARTASQGDFRMSLPAMAGAKSWAQRLPTSMR